jgi:hypothetical protein
MKKRRLILMLGILLWCFMLVSCGVKSKSALPIIKSEYPTIPFDDDKWEITGEYKTETYLGQECVLLKKGTTATLKDTVFSDGIIEFDIAFPKIRGFTGICFRMSDPGNYEEFYMRAHQSGNPDANQYTPVFNGLAAWQLYYSGAGFGAPTKYPDNEWMHVKIIVSGENALIYLKDMDKPALSVKLLHKLKKGKIALRIPDLPIPGFYSRFANFSFSENSVPITIAPENIKQAAKGTIMSWAVSNPVEEKKLAGKTTLTKTDKASLAWSALSADSSGIVNISRLHYKDKKNNTVFAKIFVDSQKNQIKKLSFGYSDRVRLFFNDKLFYSGNNTYRTRDYRYLGSIGYFDEVYLPLKAGRNEIIMAVSESFGGWGIMAKLENMEGITGF